MVLFLANFSYLQLNILPGGICYAVGKDKLLLKSYTFHFLGQ